MNIKTTRFGMVTVTDDKVIHFVDGLPGFEEEKMFVFILHDEESPFLFMQSLKTPDLAFLLVNPFVFFKDYEFEMNDSCVDALQINTEADADAYVILTMSGAIKDMTANLLAPLVVNHTNGLAKQIVLEKSKYKTKHRIFADEAGGKR